MGNSGSIYPGARCYVENLVEKYKFISVHDLVREVFGGDIILYNDQNQRGAFHQYWMGATDFYVPDHYSEAKMNEAVLREVAKRMRGVSARGAYFDEKYIQEFVARMSMHLAHLADNADAVNDSFVTVYSNLLKEALYQPTLLDGMRLYEETYLFMHEELKDWYYPTDLIRDTFDPSYMTDDEVEQLMKSNKTINQILKPKLFTNKRKAVKVARKAQKRYEKNRKSELRSRFYEVQK